MGISLCLLDWSARWSYCCWISLSVKYIQKKDDGIIKLFFFLFNRTVWAHYDRRIFVKRTKGAAAATATTAVKH
jgi:hypothetical protein